MSSNVVNWCSCPRLSHTMRCSIKTYDVGVYSLENRSSYQQVVHSVTGQLSLLSLSLSCFLALVVTFEECEFGPSIVCMLLAECKVHSQKCGCREANILLDLRNYYVMDMDRAR